MKLNRAASVLALSISLVGCAVVTPTPIQTASTFNATEVAWFGQPGTNTIKGNAVLRTVGGDVRTCAGLDANLVPVSSHSEERFRLMYGDTSTGYLAARSGFQFASTDPEYARHSRSIRCDSEGDFIFDKLPDGEYFVTARVVWGVPQQYSPQPRAAT